MSINHLPISFFVSLSIYEQRFFIFCKSTNYFSHKKIFFSTHLSKLLCPSDISPFAPIPFGTFPIRERKRLKIFWGELGAANKNKPPSPSGGVREMQTTL